MPEEYKLNYMKRYFKLHRVFYVVLLSIVIICKIRNLSPEPTTMAYYIIAVVLCEVMDEYFLWRKFVVPKVFFSIRAFVAILMLCAGMIFGPPHPVEFIPILLFCLLLVFEDMILNDVFDDFGIFVRRVLYLLFIEIGMVFCLRNLFSGVWIIMDILIGAVIVGLSYCLFHGFVDGIRLYEKRATRAHFDYVNLEEERNKLLVYQDRVEQVNSEINLQKHNLMKANSDLENMNEEVRSLIDIMKYFTTSFDVADNARYMLEKLMDLKEPAAVAIYIAEGVYQNPDPYCEIMTSHDSYRAAMVRDMYSIFEKVRRRKTSDPLVLCDNNDFKEGVLSDTNACNAVAIPAYENDKIYGVLVIVSGNYDFFESGFSFYESCLVDFTGAVQSARLYLQMKDMAIKDGLTGVYNRAYFNEIYPSICAKSIVNEQSLSVAMLDIDKFKRINDTYGHLAGDEVIRMVASVDQKYAKMHDGYAVRYGGEEFLLIIQGKTVEEFYAILQQVHDDIVKNIVKFEGEEIKVNSSIGMSNYPEIADEIVDVLDQSDQAMYFSKEHGRGMIVIFGKEEECLAKKKAKKKKSTTKKAENVKPAEAVAKPVETETKPIEDTKPAEAEQKPIEEVKPAVEDKTTETEAKPIEETKPAEETAQVEVIKPMEETSDGQIA